MYIQKHRIRSLKYLSGLQPDSKFSLIIKNIDRFESQLAKFGFIHPFDGLKILPATFNKQATKNAETYFTVNKNKEKETYYQTVYWTRTEWAGGGETREVTEFTDIARKRYHRDYHEPYSVEFTYVKNNDENYIISDELIYSEDFEQKNLNTINMLLALFGECFIESDNLVPKEKIMRLNWDVLPEGKYPWDKIKKDIENISLKSNNTQKQMMLRNCENINAKNPDFVAYGQAGFYGYVIFGFTNEHLYVLESVIPNNATYIFEDNWEELSKLSKAEILNNSLAKHRIIHNKNWEIEFLKLWRDNYV